jgi:hypothetical protein
MNAPMKCSEIVTDDDLDRPWWTRLPAGAMLRPGGAS